MELGLAFYHQSAFTYAHLLCRRQTVPQRRPRRQLASSQRPAFARARSRQATGDGQSLERGRGREESIDCFLWQRIRAR